MAWALEHHPKHKKSQLLGQTMNYLLGQHFGGIQQNTEKFFSLYYYLLANLNTPVSTLRGLITQRGKPIFSEKDLTQIIAILEKQKNSRIAKFGAMKGGANAATKGAPDASRNEFWDRFIHSSSSRFTSVIPPSWDGVIWYTQILYHLEKTKIMGPMISTALDSVTLSLPVMAGIVSGLVATMFSLAPVPYASFAGDFVAYGVSLIFVMFAVLLNYSRRHFGSAFKSSLEGVPIIGDNLAEGAQAVETGSKRYLDNRAKLLTSVEDVSPVAGDLVKYYAPGLEPGPATAPEFSIEKIRADAQNYVKKQSGIDELAASATGAAASATNAATSAATGAAASATNAATGAAAGVTNAATGAAAGVTNAATGAAASATK
jgi:hypothetical protein